ncbi:acylphosphatase [Candidatus Daviesbacteria bacterium]|nr:acylphosphatase [Candidatus Daviesbacteria bacterium]
MIKHLNVQIVGRVQAVSFRFYAADTAKSLHLTGFAKNEQDGSVTIEAEGEEDNLNVFAKWCEKGPSLAKVERVDVAEGEVKGFKSFDIY